MCCWCFGWGRVLKYLLGRHWPKDRPSSRFFLLGRVFRTVSGVETKLMHWRAAGEPVSYCKLVESNQTEVEISWSARRRTLFKKNDNNNLKKCKNVRRIIQTHKWEIEIKVFAKITYGGRYIFHIYCTETTYSILLFFLTFA